MIDLSNETFEVQNTTVRKVGRIDPGVEARRRARNSGLKAGATRKIEDKRRKPVKHRKPLRGEE